MASTFPVKHVSNQVGAGDEGAIVSTSAFTAGCFKAMGATLLEDELTRGDDASLRFRVAVPIEVFCVGSIFEEEAAKLETVSLSWAFFFATHTKVGASGK